MKMILKKKTRKDQSITVVTMVMAAVMTAATATVVKRLCCHRNPLLHHPQLDRGNVGKRRATTARKQPFFDVTNQCCLAYCVCLLKVQRRWTTNKMPLPSKLKMHYNPNHLVYKLLFAPLFCCAVQNRQVHHRPLTVKIFH